MTPPTELVELDHDVDPDGHAWWRAEIDELVERWSADAGVRAVIR